MVRSYGKAAINLNMLLHLKFEEGTGTVTRDWAKPHHVDPTLIGAPVWTALANGLEVLDFNGTPDYVRITAANSADLNFTSGAFSIAVWVKIDVLLLNEILVCRGLTNTDGYLFIADGAGGLSFQTHQGGASQQTTAPAGTMVAGAYALLTAVRSGASVVIYKNGVNVVDAPGAHTDPLTSNRSFLLGVYDDLASFVFAGQMWAPRVWGRALGEREVKFIFDSERHLFGL